MTQPDFEEEELNRLLAMIDSGSQPQSESDQLPAIAQPSSQPEDESDQSPVMTQPDFQPQDELHHIFIGYETVIAGGTQKVTLRSGKSYEVKIPANSPEEAKLPLKGCGLHLNDVVVVLHHLKDMNLQKSINNLIINNEDIKPTSKLRVTNVYELIKDAKHTEDLAALELLDKMVYFSKTKPSVIQRYNIASQNSKLIKIEECIENALTASNLDETEKQSIRGAYQYIRAGENITDFGVLNQLDSIIQNSLLRNELKELYFRYSVTSRASTGDLLIVNLIDNSDSSLNFTSSICYKKSELLAAYTTLRDGKEVSDQACLKSLDSLILNSDIPDDCKVMYKLMREPVTNENGKSAGEASTIGAVNKVWDSVKKASGFVPNVTQFAKVFGIKAGTGAAITGLSGGAATNATLALLGGGSVATGGLGMLGGLAVATGGAALLGAAALVSVASVTQMDAEDKKKLGVAAGVGVASSAAAVGTAWAAVSAFGVASTGTAIGSLSGAAAYSAAMAALGGVGVMTGGAALVAAGAGFAAWKFIKGDKNDPKRILKRLEDKLYS
ncbi:hypothetical protein OGM63_14660 [Plectonema radiosum NIES-515]|uniref:Uncharacterized protein n=1 Tax=Plectonema radiosum NIES-515 TaxID=2986073 RepID=A0ABT3B043_9CYAN|nr:hypothetical protein [Plectonema radiosum]MCV3214743.1 hypothetical protein [Plectonema radiosum NIES-515]